MGFEGAYRDGLPPWDIGRPQPAIVGLAERGAIGGRVLDIGCGSGENALYLASRGIEVMGVDAAPTAIERARAKAIERAIEVRFDVADALALGPSVGRFDVAIDCGLFHTFEDGERGRFERSLRGAMKTGGRYLMLCFSDREPGDWGPRRVTRPEIRATFAGRWRVDSIDEDRFVTRWSDDGARAWLATLTLIDGR